MLSGITRPKKNQTKQRAQKKLEMIEDLNQTIDKAE